MDIDPDGHEHVIDDSSNYDVEHLLSYNATNEQDTQSDSGVEDVYDSDTYSITVCP